MPALAICEDNRADMEWAAAAVGEWCESRSRDDVRVQRFASPYELLDALSHGESFDLFLLDILMPEMTGIALGERLHQMLSNPLLIFLTSSEDYYPDAFRLYAFQYLCKPLQKSALFSVLDRAFAHCDKQENDIFVLKTAEGLARIPLRDIVCVELSAHICHFYLRDAQHIESVYLRTGFDGFVTPLLRHRRFVKTHISYVVNLEFAVKLTGATLLTTTGRSVPVARSFAKAVQQSYVAYGLREEEHR